MLTPETGRQFKDLTTFKIGGPAKYFVEITDHSSLPEAFEFAETRKLRVLVLGGGSNMLVSDAGFDGLVIRVGNPGIEELSRDSEHVRLRVSSGEVWDNVVQFAVSKNYWGIENLSRIPGRSGAFTVQNVGAYGPEARDVVVSVEVYDRAQKRFTILSRDQCGFAYRKSIFNTVEKDRYVILSTVIELHLEPKRLLTYPDVKRKFEQNPEPTQAEIRNAIREIRDTKFPFPAESIEGNAGSFFKNSILSGKEYSDLEQHFMQNLPEHLPRLREIRHKFPTEEGIKIPTAFILDVCGLKGFGHGNVKLNPSQPVVLLNATGRATASEVLGLVQEVRRIVSEKTGLYLYAEPELIGFSETELRAYDFNDREIGRYIRNQVLD